MSSKTRTKKRTNFTEERRKTYLDCLRVTANHRAAAREAGVSERAARRYRARHRDFEMLCVEAIGEARRRLAGAEGAFEGRLDPTFESIRRGPKGEAKIVRTPGGRWTRTIEERFFAVLGATGNISAAARAVGFSREAIGKRRRKWPAFARRMEEMMEEAEIDLEFRLLCSGTGWSEAADADRAAKGAGEGPPLPLPPIDPEFALKFLKWREEKRRGAGSAGAKRGRVASPRPIDEAIDRIVAQVEAMKRHEAREAERRRQAGGEA